MIAEIATAVANAKKYAWQIAVSALLCFAVVLGLLLTGYRAGANAVRTEWNTEKAEQAQLVIDTTARQTVVSNDVGTANATAQTKIQTVFRDRSITIYKDANYESNANTCPVPNRFVRVWDSANRAEPIPDTASESDGAASAIVLDDVAIEHEREAEQYHITAQRLTDLQTWVREQERVTNTGDAQ